MVRYYNHTLDGAHLMGQSVGKHKIAIHPNTWWLSMLAHCLDVSIQQEWHLCIATSVVKDSFLPSSRHPLWAARVLIAQTFHAGPDSPMGSLSPDERVPPEIRRDHVYLPVQSLSIQVR